MVVETVDGAVQAEDQGKRKRTGYERVEPRGREYGMLHGGGWFLSFMAGLMLGPVLLFRIRCHVISFRAMKNVMEII
ncbi:MAG: hypothetical protein BWY20_02432 [Spirochaetes bacterium ADurb.Bin215]|nr:MAG: hypothetical protein BWY20_02432 [Spirochaetes bacterium ADurb.Bin215]